MLYNMLWVFKNNYIVELFEHDQTYLISEMTPDQGKWMLLQMKKIINYLFWFEKKVAWDYGKMTNFRIKLILEKKSDFFRKYL